MNAARKSLILFAIYFVASWGSDSRSCYQATSMATPFRTVARAQQCVRPGDTIKKLG